MSTPVDDIMQILETVKDPEIPVLSLPDLGVIRDISLENGKVAVSITPTFVGCPALEVMKTEILDALKRHGFTDGEVKVDYSEPWTSDKISEKGKAALKKFGIAPPGGGLIEDIDVLENAICPRCNGKNVSLRSIFGATLCRSIHYCHDCCESFEQFKPL